jgi:hypothetical protein
MNSLEVTNPQSQICHQKKKTMIRKAEGIDHPTDMPATISAFCEYWGI